MTMLACDGNADSASEELSGLHGDQPSTSGSSQSGEEGDEDDVGSIDRVLSGRGAETSRAPEGGAKKIATKNRRDRQVSNRQAVPGERQATTQGVAAVSPAPESISALKKALQNAKRKRGESGEARDSVAEGPDREDEALPIEQVRFSFWMHSSRLLKC
jgi:hypothetical protein